MQFVGDIEAVRIRRRSVLGTLSAALFLWGLLVLALAMLT